jgi:hypothetical protein
MTASFHLDLGAQFTTVASGADVEDIVGPNALGVCADIEFRLRWNYGWRFVDVGDNVDSAQDLIWSFKLAVTDQCCWVPASALEIRVTAPTGGSAWSLGRVEAGFDYIYRWELWEGWELTGSTGYLHR